MHERSQQLQISPSLNSQAILQRVRLLFLQRQHWRGPSFSLASTFLWTPIFSYAPSFYHPPKILGVPSFFHPPKFFECANAFCTYFSALIFLYTFLHSYLICTCGGSYLVYKYMFMSCSLHTNNLIGTNVLRLLG